MAKRVRSSGKRKWTLDRVVAVLMQEIADLRYEFKNDLSVLDQKLTTRIDKIDVRIDTMDRKLDTLNLKVDRNHVAFMTNVREIDGRVAVLEKGK